MFKKLQITIFFLLSFIFASYSQVTITDSGGWLETAWVKWNPVAGVEKYDVYYSGEGIIHQKIDEPLVRSYGNFLRADIPGLKEGTYTIKIIPVIGGSENELLSATSGEIKVKKHLREGFAFIGPVTPTKVSVEFVPGAYNINGTPKAGAQIIYISSKTVNTVTANVINEKKMPVLVTGLMNIIAAKNKGYDKNPLIIRLIGTIKQSEVTGLVGSGGIYIGFIGANTTDRLIENITFEGIGDDATVYGIGFFTKRSRGIEIRNTGIMLFGDDGVSMEADNFNIWVHNCDFFYGKPGSDADQVKGDGSIDMKYNTTNITISFNHFFDTGKTSFAGGATESNPIYFTYHHNWFDHSDSRHPRTCWATVHMYNNFLDGNQTMCLLNTEASSVFAEANVFRNCPYPMMINMQGTNYEKWPDGSQNGGMTKAYNNKIDKVTKLIYQTDRPTDFDAYLVNSRDEKIPSSVKSRTGGNTYSNFDTDSCMYKYTPEIPDSVQKTVTSCAGRLNGGDLKWIFNNSIDDALTVINTPLKNAITNYISKLIAIQGIDIIINGFDIVDFRTINVYPVPANDHLNIDAGFQIKEIKIYSTDGKLKLQYVNPNQTINIQEFAPGIYILRINTGDEIFNKIFIKN